MVGQFPVTIVAALAQTNRVIGQNGELPWHLPEDLQRFKSLTFGHPMIMGRKTWEFCLKKRTLPHRHNIVVSRSLEAALKEPSSEEGAEASASREYQQDTSSHMVRSLPDAFALANQMAEVSAQPSRRIFVIGGASIYAQTMAMAHCLELTIVHGAFEGDAFFPPYEKLLSEFDCVASMYQSHTTPPSTYMTYERRSSTC